MGKESTFPTPVNISNIVQLDGNDSNISDITVNTIIDSFTSSLNDGYSDSPSVNRVSNKNDKVSCALNLPTLATYNCRSLFQKLGNVSTDILERDIDVVKFWKRRRIKTTSFKLKQWWKLMASSIFQPLDQQAGEGLV